MTMLAPEVTKIGAEGYIHGWICVRPPCGDTPGHVKAAELGVTRDGTVVHRPSGYVIGSVKRSDGGHGFTASHVSGGAEINRASRADAVAAVARRHNKIIKDSPVMPAARDDEPMPDIASPHAKHATIDQLAQINEAAQVYSKQQVKKISDRIDKLEEDMEEDAKKESRTDIAIDLGSLIAAISLAAFTGGVSLIALIPLLHEFLPDIGGIFAKAVVHIRAHGAPKVVATTASSARDKLGKVPVKVVVRSRKAKPKSPAVHKADTSITSEAVAQVAQAIAKELEAGGLDADVASSMALAITSHASLALKAGKFPGDNDFITADGSPSDDAIEKSAQTAELSTVHSPLGTHGLWGDKTAQLPAYVQNIAKAMMKSGHDESSAIAMAIGAVKRWAAGRGKVTPEVRAAAGKALAEWEKLKAAHSKSESADASFFALEKPDVIKVGPEGYIHGFICVRPPCGSRPGKLSAKDLSVKRDGTIMHKPSGFAVGHVGNSVKGRYTVTHSDGHTSTHTGKDAALRGVAGHYNTGKTKRFGDEEKKPAAEVKKPMSSASPSAPDVAGSPLADKLNMTRLAKDRKSVASNASNDELKAADKEFTSRAEKLGKAGQVSRAHKVVKDEIARRNSTAKPAATAKKPPAAPRYR